MVKRPVKPHPKNLASFIRGLYARVASRLNVDPSYVSRVARGERTSAEILQALDHEMSHFMQLVEFNRRPRRHVATRNAVSRPRIKKVERAA
jgi:transcriptional regulator with XRE-family HTH domain